MPSGVSKPLLRIADQLFRLERAEWWAHVSLDEDGWDVSWDLEFHGEPRDVNEMTWRPRVRSHFFYEELPRLAALPGREFRLAVSEEGEAAFLVSVFQHESLRQARLRFGAWHHDAIDFSLTGIADVVADEQYMHDLPVAIKGLLSFDGVHVHESDRGKADAALARFFEPALFGAARLRAEGGYTYELNARASEAPAPRADDRATTPD